MSDNSPCKITDKINKIIATYIRYRKIDHRNSERGR